MKRYYSVKEASNVLAVSTNTIYKYLKEGKVKSRRIGQGRIKIPAAELAPYIEPSIIKDNNLQEKVQQNIDTEQSINQTLQTQKENQYSEDQKSTQEKKVNSAFKNTPETDSEGIFDSYEIFSGQRDLIFFRIFKSVAFLGLGLIYLITSQSLFNFSGGFLEELGQVLLSSLPFALIGVGLFNFAEVVKPQKYEKFHILVDALSLFVLAYFSFIAFSSKEYGLLVFTLSFAGIAAGHLIKGTKDVTGFTFYDSFTKFSLYLATIGGIMVILYPEIFPIEFISEFIATHKGLAGFIWFALLFAPLIYLLTPSGKKTFLKWPFFVFASSIALIIATQLTLIAKWDISYISFLTGVFGLFLVWWTQTETKIDPKRVFLISLSFFWIAGTIIFGLFALRTAREEIKKDAMENQQEVIDTLVMRINKNFDERSATLTSFAGSGQIKKSLKNSDQETAIAIAKEIYEKLDNAERVLIYDEEGIAVGVYPRNTLAQGTNFSSRDYFQQTLKTYKGYVSPVFENILGNASIIHTEPIFEENNFIGMMGVALDLNRLALLYQVDGTIEYNLRAVDDHGTIVFDSDFTRIGLSEAQFTFAQPRFLNSQFETIKIEQQAFTPRWSVTLETPVAPLVAKLSSMHIILSLLLIVNSLFSIAASVAAGARRKQDVEPKIVPASVFQSPRFV